MPSSIQLETSLDFASANTEISYLCASLRSFLALHTLTIQQKVILNTEHKRKHFSNFFYKRSLSSKSIDSFAKKTIVLLFKSLLWRILLNLLHRLAFALLSLLLFVFNTTNPQCVPTFFAGIGPVRKPA